MTDSDSRGRGGLPGVLKGLATTARTALRPSHTAEYPDVAPSLPPRSRGVIALLEENCTSCMLCARECPDWCIHIDSHKETIPATTEGGRERQRNVLDRFAIDFSLCMYCGICIEVCPFDALFWSPQFEYAEVDIRDLLHEKGRLGGVDGDRAASARARRAVGRARRGVGPQPPCPGERPCRRRRGAPTPDRPAEGRPGRPTRGAVVTALDTAFAACAVLAVVGGLLAVTTRHVVHAALWLVVALLGVAGALIVLGAELVALVLVLVYVGAVVVLVLFAMMLTRAPIGPDRAHAVGPWRSVGAGLLGLATAGLLATVLVPLADGTVERSAVTSEQVAGQLFGTWVWPFELLSVLLLAALVGGLTLARGADPDTPVDPGASEAAS